MHVFRSTDLGTGATLEAVDDVATSRRARMGDVTRPVVSPRRIAIALAALALAVVIAVVLGVGSLWSHRSSRASVNRYITSVDDVQQQMRLPLTRLLTVYRSFSTHGAAPQVQQRLAEAERTLRTLELRISALRPPPEAATLRRLLLRLVAQEQAVAREVDELTRFLPRFNAAVAGSRKANARLALALAGVRPPKAHAVRGTPKQIAQARAAYAAAASSAALAQAHAVSAYLGALALVVRRLRTLAPPPVMAPAYRAQLATLEATETAGGVLVRELHKKNRSRVPLLSRRLSAAARIVGSVASQREEIAAVKAYDSRVRAVGALQQQVQAEVSRLGRTLG
jgi:hypothetical protein